jgi:hypothetical protein
MIKILSIINNMNTNISLYLSSNIISIKNDSENEIDENSIKQNIKKDNDKINNECVLCLSEIKNNEEYIQLPCEHYFHNKNDNCCGIKEWLKKNNTCPICRLEIPKKENELDNKIKSIIDMINDQHSDYTFIYHSSQ